MLMDIAIAARLACQVSLVRLFDDPGKAPGDINLEEGKTWVNLV